MRSDLNGRAQSEPKQGFCFDCIDAPERNQPRRLLREGFEQVLHRPIEITPFLRTWPSMLVARTTFLEERCVNVQLGLGNGSVGGSVKGGARPQTAKIIGTFNERCPVDIKSNCSI